MRARTALLCLALLVALASAGVAEAAAPAAPSGPTAPRASIPRSALVRAPSFPRAVLAPRAPAAPAPKAALSQAVVVPEAARPAVSQMTRTALDATRLVSKLPRSPAPPPTAPLRVEVLMRVPVQDVDILDTLDRFGIQPQYVTASTLGMTNAGARYIPLLEKMASAGKGTGVPSRWLAIQTLGLMKTEGARAALSRLAKSPVDEARLGAVSALAAQ
jgi:hypothetical protein